MLPGSAFPIPRAYKSGANLLNVRARVGGVVVETIAWRPKGPEINSRCWIFAHLPVDFPHGNFFHNSTRRLLRLIYGALIYMDIMEFISRY